jgi:hypothetical protein
MALSNAQHNAEEPGPELRSCLEFREASVYDEENVLDSVLYG